MLRCAGRFLGLKAKSPSSRKKVVLRKLDRTLVKGYADAGSCVALDAVEVLDHEGRLVKVPLRELKGVFFVRDFVGNRHRTERKIFQSRPKSRGLWVRMTFRDKEVLEGIIPNDLLDWDPHGFLVIPPDVYSNNLKIYVPRTALTSFEVVGVISDGTARRAFRRSHETRRSNASASERMGLYSPSRQPEEK